MEQLLLPALLLRVAFQVFFLLPAETGFFCNSIQAPNAPTFSTPGPVTSRILGSRERVVLNACVELTRRPPNQTETRDDTPAPLKGTLLLLHLFSPRFSSNAAHSLTMSFSVTVAKRSAPGKPASKGWPLTLALPSSSATLLDLKKAINAKSAKLTTARQRITTEDKKPILDDSKSLKELGIEAGQTLYVKDLGPQVAWSTVFLTEYAGPLFIHPLLYKLAPTIWRTDFEYSRMQT